MKTETAETLLRKHKEELIEKIKGYLSYEEKDIDVHVTNDEELDPDEKEEIYIQHIQLDEDDNVVISSYDVINEEDYGNDLILEDYNTIYRVLKFLENEKNYNKIVRGIK